MNVMLDLETLGGFGVENAAIIQIGAVAFTDEVLDRRFCANVRFDSANFGVIDPETLYWWAQQTEKARRAAWNQIGAVSLRLALIQFVDWIASQKADRNMKRTFWASPASFDFPVIYQAADRAGVDLKSIMPWGRTRCGSTLVKVCGVPEHPWSGVEHYAPEDAQHQAERVIRALRTVERARG